MGNMEAQVEHNIDPYYRPDSEVLVLGTMPSPKSREAGFYYAHPQNRFWSVMAEVFAQEKPGSVEEKKAFLDNNHIALWDVLKTCTIKGADDASIKNAEVNDIGAILRSTGIRAVFTTGRKAAALYGKFCFPDTGVEAVELPSTSPANCGRYTYDELVRAYSVILEYMDRRPA